MSRLSLSDVVQAQEAMIERQGKQLEALTAMHGETLAALAENRRPSASESVTIKRVGTGDKPTAIEVQAVAQNGESLEDVRKRAQVEYEHAAARFPLPSGYAHPAPLGDEDEPAMPPTLVEQLEGSVKK